jgi:hypothetical protein
MQKKIWLLLFVAVLLMVSPTSVLADGDFYVVAGGGGVGTKITSLPYTINNSGFYFLDRNLTRNSGHGIIVNVDNVTIDLMGFTLDGITPGSQLNPTYGITISGRNNVEIRNGSVRKFYVGIHAGSSTNIRIFGIRAQYNGGAGISIMGDSPNDNYGGHLIQNSNASNNGAEGFLLYASGSLIGNVAYKNSGFGFNWLLGPILIDRNTASNNAGGNYKSSGGAGWGLNAGAP